jgi:chaperonin GroEL (HSP60 family)
MHIDEVTISNDGATILKLLDIVHPAAKTLVDISRAQDAEVSWFSWHEAPNQFN